jgi:hypothetical protein
LQNYRLNHQNVFGGANKLDEEHLNCNLGGSTVNQTNICFYMQPYFNFDVVFNPMVVVFDRYGIVLINLIKNEVHQIQVYEDQAHYWNSFAARHQNPTASGKTQDKKNGQDA